MNILHITPHMGGGVGNVISKLLTADDNRMNHKVILLEKPIKTNFMTKIFEQDSAKLLVCPDKRDIEKLILYADVIIIHWWHHPKVTRFMCNLPQIPLRVIIWTHISNLTVPALNHNILLEANRVIFTTEASYEAEEFSFIPNEVLKERTGVVYGCGGLEDFPQIVHEEHSMFNIGYIGLIDFSKIHPDFVDFCKAVNVPDARFIMAGDAPAKEFINTQAIEKNLKNDIIFTGYLENVSSVLSQFDVLGYPLMPYHTGTTENAILEAMMAEVPPVLLNQLTEKYIVEDGVTGILVSSKEEYGQAIRYLYDNPNIRKNMGKNARKYVLEKYTLKKFLDSFYFNCEKSMNKEKKISDFKKYYGETAAECFFSCLGKDSIKFNISFEAGIEAQNKNIRKMILSTSPLLKQENKASVFQYQREFPDDFNLNMWAEIMRNEG